jgi:hypothetical protein
MRMNTWRVAISFFRSYRSQSQLPQKIAKISFRRNLLFDLVNALLKSGLARRSPLFQLTPLNDVIDKVVLIEHMVAVAQAYVEAQNVIDLRPIEP